MSHDFSPQLRQRIAFHSAKAAQASSHGSPPRGTAKQTERSALLRAADHVAADIQVTTMRLAELSRLVRQGRQASGGASRVGELAATIKSDVTRLNDTLCRLEDAAEKQRQAARASVAGSSLWGSSASEAAGSAASSKAEADHGAAVVGNLKHSLLSATAGLQTLLSSHTASLHSVAERRERIGIRLGDDGDVDLASEFGAIDVQAMDPAAGELAQARARSQDMQEIERATSEVADMFKRLSSILAEQSEQIHGVEASLDGSLDALESGETHLRRANDRAGSNVLLGLQVAAVLLVALIGFLLFAV